MKIHDVKDAFTLLTIESFWKNLQLDGYFALQPLNYLVEEYVIYRYGMLKKKLVLSHDFTTFNCILITFHNFKY
jgi:hypothetical protein